MGYTNPSEEQVELWCSSLNPFLSEASSETKEPALFPRRFAKMPGLWPV